MPKQSQARSNVRRYSSIAELRGVIRHEWGHVSTRRAALRALWHWLICRYAYELCEGCGGRVTHGIGGTFWRAPDDLWLAVQGTPCGVLCPRCFTERADAQGVQVHWQAVRGPRRA